MFLIKVELLLILCLVKVMVVMLIGCDVFLNDIEVVNLEVVLLFINFSICIVKIFFIVFDLFIFLIECVS